ncbi:MAG: PKD domain-containing protein [Vicingus serpentipes]|nr:PKD domain-containing protein [Vicingus serpentipes]
MNSFIIAQEGHQHNNHSHNNQIKDFYALPETAIIHAKEVSDYHFINVEIKEAIYRELSAFALSNNYKVKNLTTFYLTNSYMYTAVFQDRISNSTSLQGSNNLVFTKANLLAIIKDIIPLITNDYNNYKKDGVTMDELEFSPSKWKKSPPLDKAAGEECNNPDFEQCDFTGWEMYTGTVNNTPYTMLGPTTTNAYCSESTGQCYNAPPPDPGCGCDAGGGQIQCGTGCNSYMYNNGVCTCNACGCVAAVAHRIVNSGTDAVTGVIPKTDPRGGGCTALIGDITGTGAKASSIIQTFRVSTNSANFYYSYAAVLQDPSGHTLGEKPFFKVNMYDSNGDDITCGLYSATAGDGQAGWITQGSLVYKNWTTVFVPLQAYIGQDVTIEFIVGDCSQGGHYGYAYVDVSCLPLEILTGSQVPCGPTTLSAPPGGASYLWSTGETTETITPPSSGTYSVTITPFSGAGCGITLDTTVTIGPTSVTADFSNTMACINVPFDFTDLSTEVNTTITTWAWDFGDGGTSTQQNPSHTFSSSGTFNVTLTVTSDNGCTDNVTIPINVPTCGPTVTLVGDTICIGETGTLTANGSLGALNYTFDWSGGGITGNTNNGTIEPSIVTQTDNPVTTTTYTVIITDNNGVKDTATADIVVNPLPTVSADTDAAICIGDNINITASGAATYTWDNGVPAGAGPHSVSPTTTTTYTATGTDANGCVNTDDVTITVNPLPTITTADESVCWEDSVQVCAAGGSTYTWAALDGGLFDAGTTGACVYVEGDLSAPGADYTRQYEVTGTDANGCINTAITTVTYEAVCGPTVRATGDTICINEPSANLTTVINNTTGTVIYAWSPTTNLDDPTIANPTFTPTVDGVFIYVVTITDDLGTDTDSTTITVNPLPNVSADTDAAICIGASANITASGAATYVWDNGLPATAGPHSVSPTTTTTYTATGTDVNGCVNTDDVTITVNPLPTITTADASICKDNPTNICGAGGNTYTWASLDGGLINGAANTACITVATDDPTATSNITRRYEVTGTDINGCVNTAIATVTFEAICAPIVTATGDEICINEPTAQLTTTVSNTTGTVTYAWTPTTGLNDPTIANPTVTGLTVTTTYTVIITDDLDSDTATAIIIVNPLPTPNAGMDQSICLNSSTTINAISGGTGPFSFAWDNGLPTGAGPHTVSPGVGTTTYHVVVTDANGCVNNDSVNVTVNPIPTINAGNDTTICAGESATLMATGAGAGGAYQWKDLTTGLPLAASASLLVQPSAANTCYEVTGTDINGCFSTDIVCVTVEQAPVIGFNVADVCHGTTSKFNNTTTGGATYSWDFGDGSNSNVFSPQHLYADTGTYTVTLIATSGAGCVSTITRSTRVKYVPTANFVGIELNGCPPLNETFINNTTPLDPSFSYFWDFGDGTSSNLADSAIYHTYPYTGSYTVSLRVTLDNCSDTMKRINYITVHPVPDARFTANPTIVDIYNPLINFTDFSLGADKWFWDFGDTTGAVEQHPAHVYTDTGSFTVWLRVENEFGCTDSVSKLVVVKDVYTFYAPNAFTPDGDGVNDIFLPQGHAIDEDEYTLYIFDRWGELIHKTNDYYEGWNGTYKGTPVQVDTYVWKVNLQDIYGEKHEYIGRVSIVK